jgi:hypothetical protein
MVERLRQHEEDVALLAINDSRAPQRPVAGNLNAVEAAQLGKQIRVRTVLPCHYEMFSFNPADTWISRLPGKPLGSPVIAGRDEPNCAGRTNVKAVARQNFIREEKRRDSR